MVLFTHTTNLQASGRVTVLILNPDADGGECCLWTDNCVPECVEG